MTRPCRLESPVQTFFRTTTRDIEVGGTQIPEGRKILMFLGSANRDPRRWENPDAFDLNRDPSGHVGFGFGIHQCVGQHIARLEANHPEHPGQQDHRHRNLRADPQAPQQHPAGLGIPARARPDRLTRWTHVRPRTAATTTRNNASNKTAARRLPGSARPIYKDVNMDILNEVRTAPMSRLQIRAVAVAIALMLIDGMDVAVAAYAAPALSKAWNLDPVTLGFLLSSGLVGMAAGSLFLTPFSDRIGRRRMMLAALVLVSAGMVLSVFAGDVVQLMAYRVLAGLGIGGMIANLNVFVSEYSSDKRRGSIFGLYTAGFAIGATLGGFIAGPLIPQFGWRSVFVVGAAASVLMLAVAWRFLPGVAGLPAQ